MPYDAKSRRWVALGLLLGVIPCAALGARAERAFEARRELVFPDRSRTLETLERAVTAVYVSPSPSRVIVMPYRKPFGIVLPFAAGGDTREAVFGKLTDGQRMPVAEIDADWRGVDEVDGKVLLLGGEHLTIVESDAATLKETIRRSVAWDLIRPPRDPRGEATGPETAAVRARFKKRYLETSGVRITGLARMPAGWVASKKRVYLLATRIKDFPLVTMACEADEPSSCVIDRHCHLEGAADLLTESITGIAVSAKRKTVLIGDTKRHRLVGFKFNSCYDVRKTTEIELPAKLKALTNLYVDAEDRLWLTTKAPDDYENASLYYWPPKDW